MKDHDVKAPPPDEPNVPGFWLSFLRWFCPPHLYEGIEGDLLESFHAEVARKGVVKARIAFGWNVVRFFRPGILLRNNVSGTSPSMGMLNSYLKVAWRNMKANGMYTAINVTGLTLGISIAIALFWIVRFEYNFDRFHQNAEHLYQIKSHNKFGEPNSHVPQGVIYALRREFSSVEQAATVYGVSPQVLRVGDKNVKGENTFFLHPEFLKMIDVTWISGSPERSLNQIYQVVLDEPTARKFFGAEDPIGKVIRYDNALDVVVSGVIQRMPFNSEFQFPMIMSYETLTHVPRMQGFRREDHWGGGDSWCHGFVQVKPGADVKAIEEKLASMAMVHKDGTNYVSFELMPLVKAHFDRYNDSFNYSVPFWILQTLAGIAVFIILIAIINFVNLATAQAAQRGREIGLRKVMGSNRRSIILQFFTETAVMVFLSVLLASLIATRLIEFSPEFFNTRVHQTQVWDLHMIGYLLIVMGAVTLLAGFYPALLLSGLRPAKIFQNKPLVLSGRSLSLRKLLVVFQFVVAQAMVICMVIGREQMQFFYHTDPGFEKEAVITVDMPYRDSVLLQHRFRQQLLQHPEIGSVTFALTSPSSNRNWWWGDTHHPGLLNGEQTFRLQWIDQDFLDFYKIPVLAGRNFVDTDSLPLALINEKAVQAMGVGDPAKALGEKLKYWGSNEVTVIGVVKDYYSQGLKSEIPPHLYMNGDWNFQLAQIRINPANVAAATALVEKYWTQMHPDNYFDYQFLADELNAFYDDERKFSNFILLFSVVAVTIGCLGLFGLVSFVCVRRSREISIRKVLGASLSNIISLLSIEFFMLVAIAFLIAAPIGWYVMDDFLQRYTYHIDIGWRVFALAGLSTVTVALFTVIARSLRTANENPVERLKCE